MSPDINIQTISKPRIVIVGGGFAGLELAKGLAGCDLQVVLIDKNNYHTFQPLLYQVATAALEPDSIAYPFREIFKNQKNFHFRMTEVLKIRPQDNCLDTSIGDIHYDYLVIATGSETNFYGMDDFRQFAMPMKSVPEALALRTRILENFEKALQVSRLEDRAALMNIVIVGGGPTGVETAGALGELRKIILPRDYPELDFNNMHIHLIDKEDRLLKGMSVPSSKSTQEFLKKFEVNLWLNTGVRYYDGKVLLLSNGKQIITNTVIWSAGVAGALPRGLAEPSIIYGRIKTDSCARVQGYANIFAVGDISAVVTKESPKGYPMLAPIAIQQAKNLARNFQRIIHKQDPIPFVYQDMGVMATIGRNHAVVDLPWMRFQGIFAWFVWLFVHLMALVGFRNKMVALVNWVWSYFSYDRGLRLIIQPFKK